MPFYAKTLEDNHAKQVDKELRASHAGETGAVWMYRGALFAEWSVFWHKQRCTTLHTRAP